MEGRKIAGLKVVANAAIFDDAGFVAARVSVPVPRPELAESADLAFAVQVGRALELLRELADVNRGIAGGMLPASADSALRDIARRADDLLSLS